MDPLGTQIGIAESEYYLLQLNSAELGLSDTVPIHLLVENVEHKKETYSVSLAEDKQCESVQQCIKPSDLHHRKIIEVRDYPTDIGNLQCNKSNNDSENNLKQDCPVNSVVAPLQPHLDNEIVINDPIINNIDNNSRNVYEFQTVHIPDRVVPPKAVAVLPPQLQIRQGCISPRRTLPPYICFGPVQGIPRRISSAEVMELGAKAADTKTPIFFKGSDETSVLHIDVTDKDKASWLSLLPLGDQLTANVWLYESNGEVYGVTAKPLPSRVPLALGYSKTYAEDYCLPPGQPILDLYEVLPNSNKNEQSNETTAQNHMDIYDKKEMPLSRRYYRCTLCSRTFSRLSSLKRHKLLFCTIKQENINDSTIKSPEKIPDVPVMPNIDDTRVPSDDSLPNYSLDFSTNLFDTDRMPNLDISGSSKSDTDFNPYSIPFRECKINSEVDSKSRRKRNNSSSSKKGSKKCETVPCHRCNQNISKEKKRAHLKDCPGRKFTCQCGKVFIKRENLALHIHKEHAAEINAPNKLPIKSTAEDPNDNPHSCDECHANFKRRGMLSNHLWRVHGRAATSPVVRVVRHYPCPGCHKVYAAAAKRDTHLVKHHPGVLVPGASILGGVVRRAAAACPACPRQYATRAKLLQHARAAHPAVAPSIAKENTPKTEKK